MGRLRRALRCRPDQPRSVVDALVLPAHAVAFYGPFHYRGPISLALNVLVDSWNPARSVLDTIVPPAMAGNQVGFIGDPCIESPDCFSFTAKLLHDYDGPHYHEASGTVGGGSVNFPQKGGNCPIVDLRIEVGSGSVGPNGAPYTIIGDFTSSSTLPIGSGCPDNSGNQCVS